jgi:hypothetical protein
MEIMYDHIFYGEPVSLDISNAVVTFGTGTLIDPAMPDARPDATVPAGMPADATIKAVRSQGRKATRLQGRQAARSSGRKAARPPGRQAAWPLDKELKPRNKTASEKYALDLPS